MFHLDIGTSLGGLGAHLVVSHSGGDPEDERGTPREIAHNSVNRLTLYPSQVNHLFLDLVSCSQYLQHRIDIFGAGLVDNPNAVCTLAERRARLRKYTDGWEDTELSVRYECSLENQTIALESLRVSDHNLLSSHLDNSTTISFIRVPSSKQETVKEWTLELPFRFKSHVVRSQDDLLAVLEHGIR